MKRIYSGIAGLILLLAVSSCSIIDSKGELLFGEDFSKANYEEGSWEIKDDVLVAYEDMVLWATGEFENFELSFEFKNEVGTNSGIIIYCTDKDNWIPNSVEVQIADDHGEKWGTSRLDYQCGAIFGHLPANEQKVVNTPFAELPTKGAIGFQGKHGDASISYRNVRIKQ